MPIHNHPNRYENFTGTQERWFQPLTAAREDAQNEGETLQASDLTRIRLS